MPEILIKEVLDSDGRTCRRRYDHAVRGTHEWVFARQVLIGSFFMDEGQIVEQNEPEEFFNNPQKAEDQAVLSQNSRALS